MKSILMSVGNWKFLEAPNYFSMDLSVFPKSFRMTDLENVYFPHLFKRKGKIEIMLD